MESTSSPRFFQIIPPTSSPKDPPLRLSCDACAAAKVRCDKARPRCGRCSASSGACVYGVSKKYGKSKSRRKSEGSEAPVLKRKHLTLSALTTKLDHQIRGQSKSSTIRENLSTGLGIHESKGNDNIMGWESLPPNRVSSLTPGQTTEMRECILSDGDISRGPLLSFCTESLDFEGLIEMDPLDTMDIPSWSSPDSGIQVTSEWSNPQQVQTPSEANDEPHSCFALASSTLESLHPHACLSSLTNSPTASSYSSISSLTGSSSVERATHLGPSLDYILQNNKTALKNVVQLLNCTCARDSHLAMLYAAILAKILKWYQMAGGAYNSPALDPSTPVSGVAPYPEPYSAISETWTEPEVLWGRSSSVGSTTSGSGRLSSSTISTRRQSSNEVAMIPICIGAFDLEEEHREAFSRQILLNEVHKAGRVIDQLAGTQEDSGAADLYGMLGAWLKAEFVQTMQEIDWKM